VGFRLYQYINLPFIITFFKDNEIQRYSLKKKDLFAFYLGYEDEINLFMRKNRLEHDKSGDLIQITCLLQPIEQKLILMSSLLFSSPMTMESPQKEFVWLISVMKKLGEVVWWHPTAHSPEWVHAITIGETLRLMKRIFLKM